MKPKITINEMSREHPHVVLWRRFGRGGWFLVQTAGQASDRRNPRVARLQSLEIRRARTVLNHKDRARTFMS